MTSTAFDWSSLFGSVLTSKGGEINTNDALTGKYVGLYFSAHWCPPCRGFTPKLASFYSNFKASGRSGQFEIVFVSSDKTAAQFSEYFADMPWVALPFNKRDIESALSTKFRVEGIPSLVILDRDGGLITKKGVNSVIRDFAGANFPWVPLSLQDEFGTGFLRNSSTEETVSTGHFAGKFLGIYFSAHWCPPCRQFTPKLVSFYNNRKAAGHHDFEIIFASDDKSPAEFQNYFQTMPWLAFPFGDTRIEALKERFNNQGIPTLVIIDQNWNIVCTNGVESIMSDPGGAGFPYVPKPVNDISMGLEAYGYDINSKPALVAFLESSDDSDQAAALEVLTPFAKELAESKAMLPDGPDMLFFTVNGPTPLGGRIRTICKLGPAEHADNPVMIILNIPDSGAFYVCDASEITAATVGEFIDLFNRNAIERRQLSR